MSGGDGHSRRCEEAVGHKCVCTVCGGSRHGWPGWLDLATEPEGGSFSRRIERVRLKWDRSYGPQKPKRRKSAREACIDFARLDIVAWMRLKRVSSTPRVVPHPRSTTTRHEESGLPALSGTETGGRNSDGSTARPNYGVVSASDQTSLDEPPGDLVNDPAEQALEVAEVVAIPAWQFVRETLDDEGDPDAVLIKKQLAGHAWCDLFLGLALSIEQAQGVLDEIPDSVKRYILLSAMQAGRSALTERIVGLLVDKAWEALLSYAVAHVAGLGLITGAPLLRSLRILAYLSCPEPARHRDVREHALRPLGEDAQGILKEETKRRLESIFEDWAE